MRLCGRGFPGRGRWSRGGGRDCSEMGGQATSPEALATRRENLWWRS